MVQHAEGEGVGGVIYFCGGGDMGAIFVFKGDIPG